MAGLAALLLSFDTPLLHLLYAGLPGFSLFRIPGRILFLGQLFWTVLAGLGVDALLARTPRRWHAALVLLLAALPVADAGVRMLPRIRTVPLATAFPDAAFHRPLRRDATDGRTIEIGRGAMFYGMAAVYDIDLLNGYSSLNLQHFVDVFRLLKDGDARRAASAPLVFTDLNQVARPELLAALDARSLIATEAYPLDDLGYEEIETDRDVPVIQQYRGPTTVTVHLWRMREPLGPAYFASSLHRVADQEASLAAITRSRAPRQAFVENYPGQPGWFERPGTARMRRRGIDRYEYDLETPDPGFLILSQIWYPGWTAELDGTRIPLYRTNHALLGCEVPAGRHRLNLEMTCPRFWQGLLLAAVGLAIATGLAIVLKLRRRRGARPA